MTRRAPCGYREPEGPVHPLSPNGMVRTAVCEGGRLVIRGNGVDSYTDGTMFIGGRNCPRCDEADRVEAILSDEGEETRV